MDDLVRVPSHVTSSTFKTPINERYFEDYVIGAIHRPRSIPSGARGIIAFATWYDPQSIHTDPGAAAAGRLAA